MRVRCNQEQCSQVLRKKQLSVKGSELYLVKTCYIATQPIGSRMVPVTPITASKLFWGACNSKLLYVLKLVNVWENSMIELETFHCDAARHCQGLSHDTLNYGEFVTAGWKMLNAQCDLIRLLF